MLGDLFGVTCSDLDKSTKFHLVNHTALLLLLLEKGIVTDEEYNRARLQATHIVDQGWQQRKDEERQKFEEENPGTLEMWRKLTGMEP